jgi:hypothetical protein
MTRNVKYQLSIKINSTNKTLINYYSSLKKKNNNFSHVDLYVPEFNIYENKIKKIDFQIECNMIDLTNNNNVSFYIYPNINPSLDAYLVNVNKYGYKQDFIKIEKQNNKNLITEIKCVSNNLSERFTHMNEYTIKGLLFKITSLDGEHIKVNII